MNSNNNNRPPRHPEQQNSSGSSNNGNLSSNYRNNSNHRPHRNFPDGHPRNQVRENRYRHDGPDCRPNRWGYSRYNHQRDEKPAEKDPFDDPFFRPAVVETTPLEVKPTMADRLREIASQEVEAIEPEEESEEEVYTSYSIRAAPSVDSSKLYEQFTIWMDENSELVDREYERTRLNVEYIEYAYTLFTKNSLLKA